MNRLIPELLLQIVQIEYQNSGSIRATHRGLSRLFKQPLIGFAPLLYYEIMRFLRDDVQYAPKTLLMLWSKLCLSGGHLNESIFKT